MRRDEHLLRLLEEPHTPLDDLAAPADWKEWYHFVLIDPAGGTRILANTSLSGVPGRGQIINTVIANVAPRPGDTRADTYGFSSDLEWEEGMVEPAPLRVRNREIRCEISGSDSLFESCDRYAQIDLAFRGKARASPMMIPEFTPFGSGFIGWGLVPGLEVVGRLHLGAREIVIDETWFCYHDHNYGRFRWGEDVGWIWFVAALRSATGTRFTLVLHRGNNRDQTHCGAPYLFIYQDDELRKMFLGEAVHLRWRWSRRRQRPARLPGSMATLFGDRTLLLPVGLEVRAADERDSLTLDLIGDSNTELILADNRDRQYSFIEECTGGATMDCHLGGRRHSTQGYFYAEFVH